MDQEKLDNQRDVVKNERRQRYENQPYGDWDERMQALIYPPDHPYHHTVIGSMADLSAASLEDVGEFFRTYYQPGNAVLTLAGDFDTADGLARVERYFGEIPPGGPVPPVPGRTEIEPLIGGTVREEVRAAVPLPRVYVGARIPPCTDPGFYAADVASSVLGDGRASRLYRRLVREKRVAKDVVAYAAPLVTGRSFMILWATGLPGTDAAELERAVAEELDALGEVEASEVERAVTRSETQLVQEIEEVSSRADRLSMHETIFGDASHLAHEVDRLRSVTAADVAAFARSHLGEENRAVLTYLPEGSA
jgi:predicted Zn-dependent peptidase